MSLNLTDIFQSTKWGLVLFIPHTVPILESERMICGSRKNGVLGGVGTPPNFIDYILCVLTFQKFDNIILGNDIEWVAILEVFLEQQMLHFRFILNPVHVFATQDYNVVTERLAPHLQLVEAKTDICKGFNQKTWTFDHIQIHDQNVLLTLLSDLVPQLLQKLPRMSNKHLVEQVAEEVALVVHAAIVFAKRANNSTQYLFCLRAAHISQNSKELFVKEGCHVKSVHLESL